MKTLKAVGDKTTNYCLSNLLPRNHRSVRIAKNKSSCNSSASSSSSSKNLPNTSGFAIIVAYDSSNTAVLFGTPADKAGMCVGDKIIEINGITIEGKKHSEIVDIIHKCIKSRVIRLRVRRKRNSETGEEIIDPRLDICDAYFVSVDEKNVRTIDKKLREEFPGVNIHNMETFVASGEKVSSETGENVEDFLKTTVEKKEALNIKRAVPTALLANFNNNNNDRSKSYEKNLHKRMEKRERISQEEAFLRLSSHDSTKPNQFENCGQAKNLQRNGSLPMQSNTDLTINGLPCTPCSTVNEVIPLERVIGSVRRVADHLTSKEGRDEDSKLICEYFDRGPVREAIEATAKHHLARFASATMCEASSEKEETNCSMSTLRNEIRVIETEGNLKILKIMKFGDTYLGATVRNDGDRVVVGRVIRGGIAEKSDLLREGDELIEVNGNDLRGKNVTEVCEILRSISGELSIVVVPSQNPKPDDDVKGQVDVRHFRALFDYDPEDDIYIPCKELGLKFQRGDVLHVINTSDDNWWQAYKDGDEASTSLAGLIPSSSFQEQVVSYNRKIDKEEQSSDGSDKRNDFFGCARRRPLKLKMNKISLDIKYVDEIGNDENFEILTYEEVSLYLAKSKRRRPIVLCGPEGVGSLELRQNLAESNKQQFACAVPHTTRPIKPDEIDGMHYHFISKQAFQDAAKSGRFIEYGEYQKHLYGTAISSIEAVIKKNKICILTLKPENLKALRRTSLMPYIVFIASPPMHQLRQQKELQGKHHVKDDQLKLILNEGKLIEQEYGHLFDRIIVNIDLDRSLNELKNVARSLELEPQWVPIFWLSNSSHTH